MTKEAEQFGKDIVKRKLERDGCEVKPSNCRAIDFEVRNYTTGKKFLAVVREQTTTKIGQGGAPCYYLEESVLATLKDYSPRDTVKIYVVDFNLGKIYYMRLKYLLRDFRADNMQFPLWVGDKIFFHIGQFNFADDIPATDVKKFQLLRLPDAYSLTPFSDEEAVERVINLHRKKLDGMQSEFEQVIRGLLRSDSREV